MLQRVSLENYKSYNKPVSAELRPLTLIYGYNSSGKSALVRFFRLLSDSIQKGNTSPLNLKSSALRGTNFSSLISKHSDSNKITISLHFKKISARYTIIDLPDKNSQIIESLKLKIKGQEIIFRWKDWIDINKNNQNSIYTTNNDKNSPSAELCFDGLVPVNFPNSFSRELTYLANELNSFSESFYDISANCALPERFELVNGRAKTIGSDGSGLTSILQSAPEEVIQTISSWYHNATGYTFSRQKILIGKQPGYRFALHPDGNEHIDIDIQDTGEGMGQVLPVVGLLSLASNGIMPHGSQFTFEHPELHIHPDAHHHLAHLFCDAISSQHAPRILVETHSENLLLGAQLAILQGKISAKDVIVHWVKSSENGSIVQSIEFDDAARPIQDHWPIDVFHKNATLAKSIFDKRKEKRA